MNTVFIWLADLGIQLDDHQPDDRQLAYRVALREARREARLEARPTSSPLARLAARLGFTHKPAVSPAPCACPA
jgi:hypothetical protein